MKFLIILFIILPIFAKNELFVINESGTLNVRSIADSKGEIIGRLKKGEKVFQ